MAVKSCKDRPCIKVKDVAVVMLLRIEGVTNGNTSQEKQYKDCGDIIASVCG